MRTRQYSHITRIRQRGLVPIPIMMLVALFRIKLFGDKAITHNGVVAQIRSAHGELTFTRNGLSR
jgi:hypothetical protein